MEKKHTLRLRRLGIDTHRETAVFMRQDCHVCQSEGHVITAKHAGVVTEIDNRVIARVARLAGAPESKTAGIELHARILDKVDKDQPLFTIHAESNSALDYALDLYAAEGSAMIIQEPK